MPIKDPNWRKKLAENMDLNKLHPWCHVCAKPVRGVQVSVDSQRSGLLVHVRCHSATDELFVSLSELLSNSQINLVAFKADNRVVMIVDGKLVVRYAIA